MANKSNKKTKTEQKGGWDVLSEFINGVFSLINNNRIIPAFAFVVLAIVGVVVWRIPESDLGIIAKQLISALGSSFGFLISALIFSNICWLLLTKKLTKVYKDEIQRLSDIRADLIHKKGDYTQIEMHRSSNDAKESIIIPSDLINNPSKGKK